MKLQQSRAALRRSLTKDSPRFWSLPAEVRTEALNWKDWLAPLFTARHGNKVAAIQALAERLEKPYATVRTKYYALKKHGFGGLVDLSKCGPEFWDTENFTPLPQADQDLVKDYVERNKQSSDAAIKQLRDDWACGKITTAQPIDDHTGFPKGWSIRNLARYGSSTVELAAARRGFEEARSSHAQLVYTTRAGLWPLSHIMIDDMWHNLVVACRIERQTGRPLELFSHDLFTARKLRWGFRVRTKRNDGTHQQLTEAMTRYIVAATLWLDGYNPRGTVLVAEHGTAALSGWIHDLLKDITGGLVTVSESGMTGAAPYAGQYDGIRRGNPRHKASLEASNRLVQNVFADLPGQTGIMRQRQPSELPAMIKETEALLAADAFLSPQSQGLLQLPLLTSSEFFAVATEKYRYIEESTDHDLEGWDACGFSSVQINLGGNWIDRDQLMFMPPQEQSLALALIDAGAVQTRPVKLSRGEAWRRTAMGLQRLPAFGVWGMLERDFAKPRQAEKLQLAFADLELGEGLHRFSNRVVDPEGAETMLRDGETYLVLVNPFAPDFAFVGDSKHRFLGVARRLNIPCHNDVEAVNRRMGAAQKSLNEALAASRRRNIPAGHARAERAEHNTAVVQGFTGIDDQSTDRARIQRQRGTLSDLMPEPDSPAPDITTDHAGEAFTFADMLPQNQTHNHTTDND